MRCDVTPVIFAYETKLNILQREQVTLKFFLISVLVLKNF
jgi:hypothetical protein